MTASEHIRTELEKAASLLTAAAELMHGGRLVSIASLKRMVESICTAARDAGDQECSALKPLMQDLTRRIDDFSEEMNRLYGFLQQTDSDTDS